MKIQLMLLLMFGGVLLFGCKKDSSVAAEQEGSIQVAVCSRGCYQYLIEIDGVLYAPSTMPEELKVDGVAVTVNGKILNEKVMIYKPAANDAPVSDFEVQKMEIESIHKK